MTSGCSTLSSSNGDCAYIAPSAVGSSSSPSVVPCSQVRTDECTATSVSAASACTASEATALAPPASPIPSRLANDAAPWLSSFDIGLPASLTPAPYVPPGFAPRLSSAAYASFGASADTLAVIKDGFRYKLKCPVKQLPLRHSLAPPSSALQSPTPVFGARRKFRDAECRRLADGHYIRPLTLDEARQGFLVGRLHVAESRGPLFPSLSSPSEAVGKLRLVYDATHGITKFENIDGLEVDCPQFHHIVSLVDQHGPFTAKLDFKAGFHHVPVARDHQRLLAFWRADVQLWWVWCVVPFGTRSSSGAFSLIARPFSAAVASLPVHLALYVDDNILAAASADRLCRALAFARELSEYSGVRLNAEKQVGPALCNEILGLIVDTRDRTVSIPPARAQRYAALLGEACARAARRLSFPRLAIQRVIGIIDRLSLFSPRLRGAIRLLYDALQDALRSHRGVTLLERPQVALLNAFLRLAQCGPHSVSFDDIRRVSVIEALGRDGLLDSAAIARLPWLRHIDACLATDASDTGGGGHSLEGAWQYCFGFRSRERLLSAPARELRSAVKVLRRFLLDHPYLQRPHGRPNVVLMLDCQPAAFAINRRVSTSPDMAEALRQLDTLCHEHSVRVVALWQPRERNSRADWLSRVCVRPAIRRCLDDLLPGRPFTITAAPLQFVAAPPARAVPTPPSSSPSASTASAWADRAVAASAATAPVVNPGHATAPPSTSPILWSPAGPAGSTAVRSTARSNAIAAALTAGEAMLTLQRQALAAERMAWSSSTTSTYDSHIRLFVQFCVQLQLSVGAGVFEDDARALGLFLTARGTVQHVAFPTLLLDFHAVQHYFARHYGVRHDHLAALFPRLKVLLRGLQRIAATRPRPMRAAVSCQQLLTVVDWLVHTAGRCTHPDAPRLLCSMSLAMLIQFGAIMRASEVLALRWSDVRIRYDLGDRPVLLLWIRRSKTDQFGQGRLAMCAVHDRVAHLLERYLRFMPHNNDESFVFRAGAHVDAPAIPYADYQRMVKFHFTRLAPPDQQTFGTHSLRRGGAVTAREVGVPDSIIQAMGGWASPVSLQRYLAAGADKMAATAALLSASVFTRPTAPTSLSSSFAL